MKRVMNLLSRAYLFVVLVFLYLPIGVVVAFSFNQSKNGVLWTGFTTGWYRELFQTRIILESFRNSLIVAAISCLISAVLGTMGAFGLSRSRLKGKGLIESVSTLPIMLPEIVLGLAYMIFFSLARVPFGMPTLILAHSAFCVPYVLVNVRSRLAGMDPAFEEAARDLGAGPVRAFLTVTLPLILPAIGSGALLSFAMSLDDMVISFFVTGPETVTFPVYVFGKLKTSVPPTVNAMCTLTLCVTFLAVGLAQALKRRDRR